MKRRWGFLVLAALLFAGTTASDASACGLFRCFRGSYASCGGWSACCCGGSYAAYGGWSACEYGGCSTGSEAGTVSRDLPSCSGDCSLDGTCSGGSCEIKAKKRAKKTKAPSCSGGCSLDGACATSTEPSCDSLSLDEREVALGLRLVEAANRARAARGLRPLKLDKSRVDGARSHSRAMARARSCFHLSPPTPEICAAWQTSPEGAVGDWSCSGGHAAILYGGSYTKVAPGVAYDGSGNLYWTLRIW